MAKTDANEQVKEILRQLIKQRFWIAIGFACLFAVVAYFMGSGPVKAKAQTEIAKITTAEKNVKPYTDQSKPTEAYKPIVEEKTAIMDKDVNKAWKELYERQASLQTWPDVVKNSIAKWGAKWPENVDPGRVNYAIDDYIQFYPSYVDMVYKSFDPFDYETGKGIVAAPPKDVLLRPQPFKVEGNKLPTLGKIWWAQQRLWIQRSILDVVRQTNLKVGAKDWDTAIVKQINVLEVGNPEAQDQRSLAKAEELKKAEDILSPEQQKAADEAGADSGGGAAGGAGGAAGGMASMMASMGGGGKRGEMMGSMGMGSSMGSGGPAKVDDGIYFVDKGPAKIYPISIQVLIDQDHIQDLLVEMENSPMAIQVRDIEVQRPSSPVTKPEKGQESAMGIYGSSMGSMMMPGMGYGGRGGFGGMAAMREQMMMSMGGSMGSAMMGRRGGMGPMGSMYGGGGAAEKKKVDVRTRDAAADRKKEMEELEKRKGPSLFDPYFNIVQVTVYGQARFYNPPPAEPEAAPSPGEAGAVTETPAATGEKGAGAPAPAGSTPTAAAPAPAVTTPAPAGSTPAATVPGPATPTTEPKAATPDAKPEEKGGPTPGATSPTAEPKGNAPAGTAPITPAAGTPNPTAPGAATPKKP